MIFDETVRGGGGDDTIYGESGADWLSGDTGNDSLFGGRGLDRLEGGIGNDRLFGDDAADTVLGGDGSDTVSGGRGSDVLTGGAGADQFWGSAGQQTFGTVPLVGGWFGNDTITDFDQGQDTIFTERLGLGPRIEAQSGIDLDSDGELDDSRVLFAATTASEAVAITFLNYIATARVGSALPETIIGTPFDETISGMGGNDNIRGGAGNDWISGGAGDDTIFSGGGSDSVYGDDGNDELEVFGSSAFISGGPGNDRVTSSLTTGATIITGTGNDWIFSSIGNEYIDGGSGDDSIRGSTGLDTVIGGAGRDTLAFEFFGPVIANVANQFVVIESTDRPSGTLISGIEVLELSTGADIAVNWIGGPEIRGGAGNDWIADYASVNNSAGRGNNDIMLGESGDDALYGLEGDDRLDGGSGKDMLFGGIGADTLVGGEGSDYIALGANPAGSAGDGAADVVVYTDRLDTWDRTTPTLRGADAIAQFETGIDRIDLSAVDANTLVAGDQAFTIGALTAGQAGRLQILSPTGATWTALLADVDGDGAADMTIFVYGATGQALVTAADIIV